MSAERETGAPSGAPLAFGERLAPSTDARSGAFPCCSRQVSAAPAGPSSGFRMCAPGSFARDGTKRTLARLCPKGGVLPHADREGEIALMDMRALHPATVGKAVGRADANGDNWISEQELALACVDGPLRCESGRRLRAPCRAKPGEKAPGPSPRGPSLRRCRLNCRGRAPQRRCGPFRAGRAGASIPRRRPPSAACL